MVKTIIRILFNFYEDKLYTFDSPSEIDISLNWDLFHDFMKNVEIERITGPDIDEEFENPVLVEYTLK